METKKLLLVSLRIISVFLIGILMSLLAEQIPQILGDWKCHGCNYGESGNYNIHYPTTHWGYRHWLFLIMGLCLFILQGFDIINYISKNEK